MAGKCLTFFTRRKQAIIFIMTASEFTHVIDWTEAMEQCGDDEEFLRELLSDLRGEIDAQIVKMDEVLQVRRSQKRLQPMKNMNEQCSVRVPF